MNIFKEVMEMLEIRFKRLEHEMGILNRDIFGAGSMTEEQLMREIDWLESRPKLSTKEEFEKLKNAYPGIAEAFASLFALALRATPKSPAQRRMQEMIRKDSWVQSQLASIKKPNCVVKTTASNPKVKFSAGTYKKRITPRPSYVNTGTADQNDIDVHVLAMTSAALVPFATAKTMAFHYLEASGLNYNIGISDIKSIFSSSIGGWKTDATSYVHGLNLNIGDAANFHSSWTTKTATRGLHLALGTFSYCLDGSVIRKSNGSLSVTIAIRIYDYYDFLSMGTAMAGLCGLQDQDWHNLAVVGLACPYNVYGAHYFSFTIEE